MSLRPVVSLLCVSLGALSLSACDSDEPTSRGLTLTIDDEVSAICVDTTKVIALGQSNRREWVLLRADALARCALSP